MGKRVGAVMASVSCHHRHLDGQYREVLLTRAVTAALLPVSRACGRLILHNSRVITLSYVRPGQYII